jgi:hypothetical protein
LEVRPISVEERIWGREHWEEAIRNLEILYVLHLENKWDDPRFRKERRQAQNGLLYHFKRLNQLNTTYHLTETYHLNRDATKLLDVLAKLRDERYPMDGSALQSWLRREILWHHRVKDWLARTSGLTKSAAFLGGFLLWWGRSSARSAHPTAAGIATMAGLAGLAGGAGAKILADSLDERDPTDWLVTLSQEPRARSDCPWKEVTAAVSQR